MRLYSKLSSRGLSAGSRNNEKIYQFALDPADKPRDDSFEYNFMLHKLLATTNFFKLLAIITSLLLSLLPLTVFAQNKTLNIYIWANEIPPFVIQAFQKETGIKVNVATFENNEMLYAKLRTTKQSGYDIIMPSGYFVDRMRKQNMLEKLDISKLTKWKNINPVFLHPSYDPLSEYSVPHMWGVTGMFVNQRYFPANSITKWSDLWQSRFDNQLLMLDDTREVFAIALLSLGYSVNDRDPVHIKEAFLKLKSLMKNIKVFSSDTIISIMIDEDATAGMSWNGETYKAMQENPNVHFIFPTDGFVIWVDNFCIPKNALHKDAAYMFINYILRAEIGKEIALATKSSITNLAAQKILPPEIRDNPVIYPSEEVLKHGQFQVDVGDETTALYEKYWEELKMGG